MSNNAVEVVVEYCGADHVVGDEPFAIGREGNLVLDPDNRHLHRSFLTLSQTQGVTVLTNVGSQLTATVSDEGGRLEAFLAPGAVLPLVFERTVVRFTVGPTQYEFTIRSSDPSFAQSQISTDDHGDTTVGQVSMTPDQLLLVVALAEPTLRREGSSGSIMPTTNEAAARLGWSVSKFNRKLDNVCQKLAAMGVRGLHGEPGNLASNRRARLVEYAVAVRLVTTDDLSLLPSGHTD